MSEVMSESRDTLLNNRTKEGTVWYQVISSMNNRGQIKIKRSRPQMFTVVVTGRSFRPTIPGSQTTTEEGSCN
jgi:hypothetical protein